MIFPAYFLPSVEYIQHALKEDKLLIEVNEFFPKQTSRNRFQIYAANGMLSLSMPLEGRRNKTLTKDIRLSYNESWNSRHWRSIVSAYRSSPFFEHYEHYFISLFNKKYTFLVDLNMAGLEQIFKALKTPLNLHLTKEFQGLPVEQEDLVSMAAVKPYYQVFSDKHGFLPSLSILDLIFHQGPEAKTHLLK